MARSDDLRKTSNNPNLSRQFTRKKEGSVHGLELSGDGDYSGSTGHMKFQDVTRRAALNRLRSLGFQPTYSVTKLQRKD